MLWLRRVTPDLFLAAVVALLLTLALQKLDSIESQRIISEVRFAADDGLSIDERIQVFEQSIRRSILLHQPLLILGAAVVVGFLCRLRRWAWLTAILSILPVLVIGLGYLIDTPAPGAVLVVSYLMLTIFLASITVRVRDCLIPVEIGRGEPFRPDSGPPDDSPGI